jgi:5-(carboxyamino)imidazole ribonucleotide mutase
MKACESVLDKLGIARSLRVLSAHRTPDRLAEFVRGCEGEYDVIIAAAGKSAALAGVIASGCALPVVGVPMSTSVMGGLDSLLSTVQMPSGVPVACVAIDGSENAALLAARIIALSDGAVREALVAYTRAKAEETIAADRAEAFD